MPGKTPVIIGFATTNPHKLRETQQCLAALDPTIHVDALLPRDDVDETGQTFTENALIKLHACLQQPIPEHYTHVITEDAGLVIDALDGRYGLSPFPGVKSDRWFSPEVQRALLGRTWDAPTYAEKNQGLLALMAEITDRKARYEACIACWDRASNTIFTETGTVPLLVAETAHGDNGFGYDPIMIPVDVDPHRTMAELSADAKNQISHRCRALGRVWRRIADNAPSPHPYGS